MITLEAIRGAVLAPDPYTQMDRLIRAEMDSGRKLREIFEDIKPLIDETLDTPGLTEDGEEAFLGIIDALTGNCKSDQCYRDPPRADLPAGEEIASLPRWARVAFAARCAQRIVSFLIYYWPEVSERDAKNVSASLAAAERAAAEARPNPDLASMFRLGAVDAAAHVAVQARMYGNEIAEWVAHAVTGASYAAHGQDDQSVKMVIGALEYASKAGSYASTDFVVPLRRDFDHLANLAHWQHWTDETPVPSDVFGPLWPEGPPPGWPADPDLPQRTDLPLELVSAARVLEQMTEDDAVRVFSAINAYYIARTGDRLTLEDLRPLIAAGVRAEV